MEFVAYSLFKVDIRASVKNKIAICKHFHIQPSELSRLQYWEYEYFLDEINNDVEAQREHEEEENKKYSNFDPSKSFKMPEMPSMPSFSMPSF